MQVSTTPATASPTDTPKTDEQGVLQVPIKPQFFPYKRIIEAGDLVIAYMTHDNMIPLIVQPGLVYNNRFGVYHHDQFIGKPFGSKIASHTGRGFMYLLHPTPELWTLVLPHRTQILYQPDISFISTQLELRPGCVVLESGTGSGSFSHSIIRSILPNGHLYTYEFHEARAKQAAKEFTEHGLADFVTLTCRDVCKEGFTVENCVDAVFLDLPAPWEALPWAKRAFKQHRMGRICCFSPCIEQVQRTCDTLRALGFRDVRTFECLQRSQFIRTHTLLTVEQAVQRTLNRSSNTQRTLRKRELEDETMEDTTSSISSEPATTSTNNNDVASTNLSEDVKELTTIYMLPEARGHTSYLTFATFVPCLDITDDTDTA